MASFDNLAALCDVGQIKTTKISKILIESSATKVKEWDLFVAKCGCSYRCLYRASWVLHGNHKIPFSVRRFDIILESSTEKRKIGQFVLVTSRTLKLFSDQLQLLPEWQYLWHEIMQRILEELGPGRYRYGSEWMTGPCRAESLRQFPNVNVLYTKKARLEAVDFSLWSNWNDYWSSISKNITRNYNKYIKESESQGLIIASLRHSLIYHFDISRLKVITLVDKGVSSSKVRVYLKSAMRYLVLSRHIKFVICVASNGRLDSFAACVAIGANTYYLEGGSSKIKMGSGWFTLMNAMRQAYHAGNGRGLFIMGPVDDDTTGKPHWIGLEQSRQQCRVVQRPVSIVDFEITSGVR